MTTKNASAEYVKVIRIKNFKVWMKKKFGDYKNNFIIHQSLILSKLQPFEMSPYKNFNIQQCVCTHLGPNNGGSVCMCVCVCVCVCFNQTLQILNILLKIISTLGLIIRLTWSTRTNRKDLNNGNLKAGASKWHAFGHSLFRC